MTTTPEQQAFDAAHARRMQPAIQAGSAAVAREVFASSGVPSAWQLRSYLTDAMWQDGFEDMARHARSENTPSRHIMATGEAEFEAGLVDIVRVIATHTRMSPDNLPHPPGQDAFETLCRPQRMPTLLAVVQETLLQDPSWKPDIKAIFSSIGTHERDDQRIADQYRKDKADHINTLGAAVTRWLATEAPPTLMMRMSAPDQMYWRQEGWRTDERLMPAQTPTQQMAEFDFFRKALRAMPKTEASLLVVSPAGRKASEMAEAALQRISSRAKPRNT